jgi:hypothetical protein
VDSGPDDSTEGLDEQVPGYGKRVPGSGGGCPDPVSGCNGAKIQRVAVAEERGWARWAVNGLDGLVHGFSFFFFFI